MPSCRHCSQAFEITKDDLHFYEKVSPVIGGKTHLIPPPTLCPACRKQRRFSHRNERRLYHRKCDATGRQIISAYAPTKPFKVYQREEWLSDKWDALAYGQSINFEKPFFEQYAALQRTVPALALSEYNNENCSYTNYVATSKNCYLIFGSVYCEDCHYGSPYYSVSCVDSLLIRNCELCIGCITCEKCYGCTHCIDCVNSASLIACSGCEGCKHCIGCTGLRNAEYQILNMQVSHEDFESKRAELRSLSVLSSLLNEALELRKRLPCRSTLIVQSEGCTGSHIYESRNAVNAFDVQRCQDCAYVAQLIDARDCQDTNYTEEEELCYEYFGSYHNQRQAFCCLNFNCTDALYSSNCHGCQNIFGCIGLQRKSYCILNTQHTKEEYEDLAPRLIEHMQSTREYGEFFPTTISPFAYNETVAQDYFPLSEQEVGKRGWAWEELEDQGQNFLGPKAAIRDSIDDIGDGICREILTCEKSGKPYKIIPQELRIYRELTTPLPRRCPEQRLLDRIALRNPRKLWSRACSSCGKSVATNYSPDRSEKILCDVCYLTTVY
jgi:hypothetical protein